MIKAAVTAAGRWRAKPPLRLTVPRAALNLGLSDRVHKDRRGD